MRRVKAPVFLVQFFHDSVALLEKAIDPPREKRATMGEVFAHLRASARDILTPAPLRRLVGESMVFHGLFRASRDYLQPALAITLALDQVRETANPGIDLTSRERAVLTLIGDGLVNKEIAVRLGVSVNTIQTYRARMMEKLSLHTVAELIRYAIRRGIIKA